jgi:large subunit ribosomal protein L39e
MGSRKPTGRKIRLMKKKKQTSPVPAWIILRTRRSVRTNPKRRAWRSTDVEVG